MKKILLACLMAFISVSMYAEKQVVTLYIPDMECETCKGKVDKVLAFERGVKKLDYNVNSRTVVIVYEDKRTSVEKIQQALVKFIKYESEIYNPKVHGKACSSTCAGHHGHCAHGNSHQH